MLDWLYDSSRLEKKEFVDDRLSEVVKEWALQRGVEIRETE